MGRGTVPCPNFGGEGVKGEAYRLCFTMKAEGDEAEVMVYSAIASDKWFDEDVTPGDFDKALKAARKGGATRLHVRINSGGGEVYAAVAMRSMIIGAGFESVRMTIEGLCASAATLFATVPGARVTIAQGSEFMIHNPMTIAWGNAAEIEKTVDHLRKMEGQFAEMYAERTGIDAEDIREMMDAETWMTAKEAVEKGFCDEVQESQPVAACVSAREMALMRSLYRAVPGEVTVEAEKTEMVSNEDAAAADSTEIQVDEKEDAGMDVKELSLEQLREGNPALLNEILNSAVAAERQRQQDIDALTLPGYEAMAARAKADGTSAMDFQKQLVAAMRQKGADFIEARRRETEPAKDVAGGAPEAEKSEADAIEAAAKEIARYAAQYAGSGDNSMF